MLLSQFPPVKHNSFNSVNEYSSIVAPLRHDQNLHKDLHAVKKTESTSSSVAGEKINFESVAY